jgi:hypothetical protein
MGKIYHDGEEIAKENSEDNKIFNRKGRITLM